MSKPVFMKALREEIEAAILSMKDEGPEIKGIRRLFLRMQARLDQLFSRCEAEGRELLTSDEALTVHAIIKEAREEIRKARESAEESS